MDDGPRDLFDGEHELFRRTVRDFVERELRPEAEETVGRGRIAGHLWRKAGDVGLLGFMVPSDHGGGGVRDFRFNAVLGEELARLGFAYSSSFGINVDVVAPYLLDLTTEEQRRRWLPGFATGQLITAIAITEPGTGSDMSAITTTATPGQGGWVVNGAKTYITNGTQADLILVVARTGGSGHSGLTIFAVPGDAPGLDRRPLRKIGQHEADTAELAFVDVRIPQQDVVGDVDRGFYHLVANLPQERLACAVAAVAHGAHHLEQTIDFVRSRQVFGAPIAALQHIRFTLARLRTELSVTRAFVDGCVRDHSRGVLSATAAAQAKYWATEVQGRVLDECLQFFGGAGYMSEYDIGRAWVDARVTRIYGGTSEIMREVIARDMGLPQAST